MSCDLPLAGHTTLLAQRGPCATERTRWWPLHDRPRCAVLASESWDVPAHSFRRCANRASRSSGRQDDDAADEAIPPLNRALALDASFGEQLAILKPGLGPAEITRDPLYSIPLAKNSRYQALVAASSCK